jgi:hypothetical protein
MDDFNKFMKAKGLSGLGRHLASHPRMLQLGGLLEGALLRLHAALSRSGWYVRQTERLQARHEACRERIAQARQWLKQAWELLRARDIKSLADLRQGLRDILGPVRSEKKDGDE